MWVNSRLLFLLPNALLFASSLDPAATTSSEEHLEPAVSCAESNTDGRLDCAAAYFGAKSHIGAKRQEPDKGQRAKRRIDFKI